MARLRMTAGPAGVSNQVTRMAEQGAKLKAASAVCLARFGNGLNFNAAMRVDFQQTATDGET
ncbi:MULTISPECIES: hypothetical protein [unclassified Pseudomonas]|uniref:hypothetical protein n=1 Tax=unclassified Pseudomonas TaxID=196821 RepID=UPI0011B6A78C|nr:MULTISPECIES: hypothetical protein [unclassified Pseudomonas]